ncbi:MAG: electron transfer flavoprotein subunit beta/FixA family protein [Bacteroidota bacterium]|nr:electron transfer flavoprotein subunit beta/FixA family protein [Bacteroidota bacterium]
MKILVCISCVPDTTSKINFKNNNTEFDDSQIQYIINPNDEFGLTRAIWFKENDGAEIDVISVGLESNDQILRKALAIGADRGFRINQEAIDSFQVAKLLSTHISNNNYDLVIAGRESIDYNGGMVPGIIAEILNFNYVTNCVSLEITNNSAKIKREIEGGVETLTCKLPLIIGAQKGLVEESDLKIPNMRGIMQARQKPFEIIQGETEEIKTKTIRFEKPEGNKEIKLVSPDNLDELIDYLHNEAKVI